MTCGWWLADGSPDNFVLVVDVQIRAGIHHPRWRNVCTSMHRVGDEQGKLASGEDEKMFKMGWVGWKHSRTFSSQVIANYLC